MTSTSSSSPNSSTMKDHIQALASQISSSMSIPKSTSPATPPAKDVPSQGGGTQTTVESMIRVMFGACTSPSAGDVVPNDKDELKLDVVSPVSSRERSKSTCEPASPDPNFTETVADKYVISAISNLRGGHEQRKGSLSADNNKRTSSSKFPVLFPASSPAAKESDPIMDSPALERIAAGDKSFDDTVSELSAHTLEEMALAYEAMDGFKRIRSDRTHDPRIKAEESWKETVGRRWGNSSPDGGALSPVGFGRLRSTNTRYTYTSHSTMSTQTHEFADLLQKDEANYWSEVVKEQDDQRDQSTPQSSPQKSREMLHLKRDGTITTVHSSTCSGMTPSRWRSVSHKDPDRLMDVLVMPPGTDMAEI